MNNINNKILFLEGFSNLPHYAKKILTGVQKAYKEGREIEVSSNSILFINRMWENRTGEQS